MKFDFGIMGPFTDEIGPNERYRADERLKDMVELAPVIERSGFEKAWVTERHFKRNALSAVMPFCAALGARTDTLTVGTGVALAPFHHPIRFAEDAAVIDLLTGGRFEPGLSIGWNPEAFEVFDVPKHHRVAHLVEMVDILRDAWTEGPLSYDGDIYQYDDVDVHPKPTGESMPIWIGGTADPAIERAGRIGDGLYATATPLDELARKRDICVDASGDDDFPIAEWRYTHVSEDGDAWEEMKPSVWAVKRKYLELGSDEEQPHEMPADMEAQIREDECIVGTPEEVRDQLRQRRERLGDSYRFVARMGLPGMATEDIRRSTELFGEEVVDEV